MPDRKDPKSQKPANRVRKARPTAPGAEREASEPSGSSPAGPPVVPIPDDDLVMIPAPTTEDFLRKAPATQHRKMSSSTTFRRTAVPLLLTHGLLFPILGGLWFITDDNSPFRRLGLVVPLLLFAIGGVLLFAGVLNVLSLKHLQQSQAPAGR